MSRSPAEPMFIERVTYLCGNCRYTHYMLVGHIKSTCPFCGGCYGSDSGSTISKVQTWVKRKWFRKGYWKDNTMAPPLKKKIVEEKLPDRRIRT